MKIAFILGAFPALSETFVLNQITGLIDLGHKVDIYAHSNPLHKKIHPDVKRYNLLTHTYYLHRVPKNLLVRIIIALKLLITNIHKDIVLIFHSLNFIKQ